MMAMTRICNMIHGLKPTIMMVVVQFSFAGVNVFYKLAASDGMSVRILVAYRFMFAAAAVLPLALYFGRNSRPKLTWTVLFQAFISALFGGSLAQNLYGQSLVMTSATFASATTNLTPALTFTFAIFFRLEKFELKTMAGKAKVIGTLICMSGAMILTFYKGIEIKLWPTQRGHLQSSRGVHVPASQLNRIMGPLLAIASAFSCSLGLIFQAKMSEKYPCHYSSTTLICLMGTLQAVVMALAVERNRWDQWKLGWDIRLLSVAYSGIVASGLMVILTMWCVRMRGPLFVSVFSPLMLILVAIAGSLFLAEELHLGSVVGATVIVCGLYSVLWGKGKEMKKINRLMPSLEKSDDEPVLEMSIITSAAAADDDENEKDAKSTTGLNMMAIGVAPS